MGTARWHSIALVIVAACANANDGAATDAAGTGSDGGSGSGSGSGSGMASQCMPGQLARGITGGQVTCAPIEPAAQAAIDAQCSLYYGWRDSCDGCLTDPAKWGLVGGGRCMNGLGTGGTCTTATLGTEAVSLFGINPGGDVDSNDKLYTTLHCTAAPASEVPTPCPADHFMTGASTCAPLAGAVIPYVQQHCVVYVGWQDDCNGCTTAPVKWGWAGDLGCMNGAGADDTCTTTSLGGEQVKLFGLNPDGDVDGNDKLHIALHCNDATPATTTASTICPAGMFVAGTVMGGGFACENPGPTIAAYVRSRCSIYLGWRDDCSGCTNPPSKWGTAKVGACANGLGADNTCSSFSFAGTSVSMFGLSPDGDVDDNDAIYLGFDCN